MAHMLIAEDTEAYQEAYMEEFIKGFEILKLRIGKLKSYSTELDQMVSPRIRMTEATIILCAVLLILVPLL